MLERNRRGSAALALVALAAIALACGSLKNLGGGGDLAEANKLVQSANDDLKEIDRIAEDNEQNVRDLDKATDAGNTADVKRILGELIQAIDDGLKRGESARDKIEKASKMDVDAKYKEYLSLKAQSLSKQIEAFKERQEAARIMRDNYDSTDKAGVEKAKADFRKKNDNYKKLLGEAKDLSRKAEDIARQNPDKIKPSS